MRINNALLTLFILLSFAVIADPLDEGFIETDSQYQEVDACSKAKISDEAMIDVLVGVVVFGLSVAFFYFFPIPALVGIVASAYAIYKGVYAIISFLYFYIQCKGWFW